MRFELTTLTLARLCSTPELRPHPVGERDVQTILSRRKRENLTISDFFHAAHQNACVILSLPFVRRTESTILRGLPCQIHRHTHRSRITTASRSGALRICGSCVNSKALWMRKTAVAQSRCFMPCRNVLRRCLASCVLIAEVSAILDLVPGPDNFL